MLKKSLVANYLGQGACALMSFAFIPAYIRILGLDAYGLIGVYAIFQTALNVLSAGLTPLLSREIAISSKLSNYKSFRTLLRSSEILLSAILFIALTFTVLVSPFAARNWLSSSLSPEDLSLAIIFMVILASLRIIESFYSSILLGLQRQLIFNVIQVVSVFLRSVGVLAILTFVSPTIHAFFGWQIIIAVLTILFYFSIGYSMLPRSQARAHFSLSLLRSRFKFFSGVAGVTLVSMLISQSDKIVLSSNVDLSEFAIYALATTMAGTLILLVTPISQAFYPRFCALHAAADTQGLASEFHLAAQITTLVSAPLFFVLFFFAAPITFVWTNDQTLAESIVPIFRLLLIGAFFNSMLTTPAQSYYATGLVAPLLRITVISLFLLYPYLLFAIPLYQSYAAALSWLLLNFGFFLFQVRPLFVTVLSGHLKDWYLQDILVPFSCAILPPLLFYSICTIYSIDLSSPIYLLPVVFISLLLSAWFSILPMRDLRHVLKSRSLILAKIM